MGELAQVESKLGKLQAEVQQSNSILERVRTRELQKEQELNNYKQQLATKQDTLLKAEKLANTANAFVTQALQNNGAISAQVLAKFHLLDVAHQQILAGMGNNPSTAPMSNQIQTPSNNQRIIQNPQPTEAPPVQQSQSISPRSGEDNYQYFGLSNC